MSHSWEDPQRRWSFGDPDDPGSDADASEDDEAQPTPEEAGDLLVEFLLVELYHNKLSARTLCTVCHWASKAGALGAVANFALSPDSPSGHFQRKIDAATGVCMSAEKARMYSVPVPQYSKCDAYRTNHDMVIQLPHEVLHDEIKNNPQATEVELEPEWTEAYETHPVVQSHPDRGVVPYAMYLDGISFTKTDSLLGVFVYSLITLTRHLVAVFRKSHLCRCGCKGWCSLYPVFRVLRWSFECLAAGFFP